MAYPKVRTKPKKKRKKLDALSLNNDGRKQGRLE